MWIKSAAIWLLASIALVLATDRVVAQPAHSNLNYQTPHPTYENGPAPFSNGNPGARRALSPFHPVGFEAQFDWFAPAETSGYGRGLRPHIGYFFSYERLYWSLSAPKTALIGSATPPSTTFNQFFSNGPTVDTSWIGSIGAWGNRYELGYIDTDDYGWLVSVLDHVSQGQYRIDASPGILLTDPGGVLNGSVIVNNVLVPLGSLPFLFAEIRMKNQLYLNGVELMRFYRARQLHSGAFFELLYGVRWFQINDTFIVEGDGNGQNTETFSVGGQSFSFPLNILDPSVWSNRALNNLVGPQIGVRFFRQRGRWVTSLEARFLAAANFQNLHMKTDMATDGPGTGTVLSTFRGLGTDTHLYRTTFSPMGELRVNVSWQATRNVGLKIGYTGMVVGGISRASNTIDYGSVNLIGILNGNYNQIFFVNGLNFGVEVNR